MKNLLEEINHEFPFSWADLNSYRDSNAYRNEFYLKDKDWVTEDLIGMFDSLFGKFKANLLIFNRQWWNFCLETWDIESEANDYNLAGKSEEAQNYLKLLINSQIQVSYDGCCICNDWPKFLKTILECVVKNKAPYSPVFCDIKNEYFFYFHESGSIGIYYKERNPIVMKILKVGHEKYSVQD